MWHMTDGWVWAMWIGMVIFWASIIALAVWAVRRFSGRPDHDGVRTLEERFARGEIDEQEFEERRRILSR